MNSDSGCEMYVKSGEGTGGEEKRREDVECMRLLKLSSFAVLLCAFEFTKIIFMFLRVLCATHMMMCKERVGCGTDSHTLYK